FKEQTIQDNLTQIQNLNQNIKFKEQTIQDNLTQIQNLNQNIKLKEQIIQDNLIQMQLSSNQLSFFVKYNTAKTRIQNQLSYKLGQAMVVNSKSLLGYLIMPIALLSIMISHKQEQKIYQEKIKKDSSLKLPPLESYPDYKEALKEKECLTYKLGQALIKANKTWYGGGYIKLLFEIKKLKREFRNRKI
ncbi:alpha-2,3-sialyltransferase, partial [Campylobacter lari]